jgi:hypothetical protein
MGARALLESRAVAHLAVFARRAPRMSLLARTSAACALANLAFITTEGAEAVLAAGAVPALLEQAKGASIEKVMINPNAKP